MRKIAISAIAISLILFAMVSAETTLGLKAGGIVATEWGDIENTEAKIGFTGGPYINFNLSDAIDFQTELRYSMEGTKFELGGVNYSMLLNYIEIPLLLKFKFLQEKDSRPSFYFGPKMSILVSAETQNGTTVDIKDNVSNFDAGVVLGIDLINDRKLLSDFRIAIGLLNIVDDDTNTDTNRNANFSVCVGVQF